jgi:hypothetical protein
MSGVSADPFLGKHEGTVRHDLEAPAGRFDELDGGLRIPILQCSRQTGGFGSVVSDDAVFDRDMHRTIFVRPASRNNPARAVARRERRST